MNRRRFRDYGIRPKGSPEVPFDPNVLAQMIAAQGDPKVSRARKERVAKVYRFMLKVALTILPPEQRKIFYSVWVRSDGKLNKGVMEYSRKVRKSHFTSYNNYYKAVTSLRQHLEKTGYEKYLIEYLRGAKDDLPDIDDGEFS